MTDRRSVEPGAYAVVRGDEPRIFLAEDAQVISRVLATELVAATRPEEIADDSLLERIRAALLDERWADALVAWMAATGDIVDVYEGYLPVHTDDELDVTTASLVVRCSPMFDTTEAGHPLSARGVTTSSAQP